MVHPQEQLSIEEIPSPIESQMFDFCESELFRETLEPNSEVASSSNGCYEEQQSCYNNPITPPDMHNYTTTTTGDNENQPPLPPPSTATGNPNPPIIFDDISASIDFTITSPSFLAPQHNQYLNNINNNNMSQLEQFTISSSINGHQQLFWPPPSTVAPIIGPPALLGNYDDECMPSSVAAALIRLRFFSSPTCALIHDPMMAPYLPTAGGISAEENTGIFGGNGLVLGNDVSQQELDFDQGDNGGLFLPDTMQRVFNCGELQALSSESQHLVHGGASEISSLEDPTSFKVGKLSVEERQRKIHRYLKKRNERNFSKKIKYACRKTLADSRPRVRGRFAKNDELGGLGTITNGINYIEDDNDEDVTLFSNSIPADHQTKDDDNNPVEKIGKIATFVPHLNSSLVAKEEDDMESSDIFAHISGVNSFKCNYPIQSWI